MSVQVKICGLKTAVAVQAACDQRPANAGGADMVGFVFFKKSPRNVTPPIANALANLVPPGVIKVALTVDATDDDLTVITAGGNIDLLQLHGSETPERVAQVKGKFGLKVMKALPIASPEDLNAVYDYQQVADRLLFDAKPPSDADRPGGNAVAFDWGLLAGTDWSVPWLLAGGLTPGNVAEAIRIAGAPGVDVSSGVETAPGEKSADLIRDFLAAAKGAA